MGHFRRRPRARARTIFMSVRPRWRRLFSSRASPLSAPVVQGRSSTVMPMVMSSPQPSPLAWVVWVTVASVVSGSSGSGCSQAAMQSAVSRAAAMVSFVIDGCKDSVFWRKRQKTAHFVGACAKVYLGCFGGVKSPKTPAFIRYAANAAILGPARRGSASGSPLVPRRAHWQGDS